MVHTGTHTCTHLCTHIHTQAHKYAQMYKGTHMHKYSHRHAHMNIYIHTYTQIHAYTHTILTQKNKVEYKMIERNFDTLKKGRASIATSDCELYTYSDIQIRLAVAVQFMVDLWLLLEVVTVILSFITHDNFTRYYSIAVTKYPIKAT